MSFHINGDFVVSSESSVGYTLEESADVIHFASSGRTFSANLDKNLDT